MDTKSEEHAFVADSSAVAVTKLSLLMSARSANRY
jgi:hypothetical protein